jgi:2-C-methyl-D-erythritol 4-phosphate cytidylyltransferase
VNIALILAGGTGNRMNARSKPKQFLELHGKPILFYTLDFFESHREIDGIVIVCIKDWMNNLEQMLSETHYKKVMKIVEGGPTGHESIYNGLRYLSRICLEQDIVLIHDGVRPLISEELITENIQKAKLFEAVITAETVTESVIESSDNETIQRMPNRNEVFIAKAPQTFRFGLIWKYHQLAKEQGCLGIDSAHLLNMFGVEMHIVKSTPNNIKITAPMDYYIFRALYEMMENQQILNA